MMQELKHDLFESSKQLPSIKLFKTIYQLPHEAFSVSNQIAMNEAISTFAMNIKSKAKNTSVHTKQRSVSLSHTRNARIRFYSNKNKNKNIQTLQVKHIRCDGIKI